MYQKFGKRTFDICSAIIGLILISPFLIIIALLLTLIDRQLPLFLQPRPGLKNKIFVLVKFATMHDNRDDHGDLLPDLKRVTALGKFLRKTSIDELPQLWNVLVGDMSLVGPRPLLTEYLPLYNTVQQQRHNVKPGITGWAQVNGRNALQWEDKFSLDIWYVNHISFRLDLKILGLTIRRIFSKKYLSAIKSISVEKFTGTRFPSA